MRLAGGRVEEWGGSLSYLEEDMMGRGVVNLLMSIQTGQRSR
jgi:hypothetical protein